MRALALAAAAVLAAAACSTTGPPGGAPTPSPQPSPPSASPTQSPEPEPPPSPPPPEPVTGERHVTVAWVSNANAMFHGGDPRGSARPLDEAAVGAAADRVAGWLDGHLTDLQDGGPGRLDEVAEPGLLAGADPHLVAGLTWRLANPEHLPASTRYDLVVRHDGTPEWVEARVTTATGAGTLASAFLLFAVDGDRVVLVAAGPADPRVGE